MSGLTVIVNDLQASSSVQTPDVDVLTAGALTIGGTTATSVSIGASSIAITLAGPVNSTSAKGDILGSNASGILGVVSVGVDGQFLTASSAQPNGLSWTNGITDHGGLTGLGDDDHAQYLNINGRSGGQTASGGTLTTNSLTLRANAADITTGSVNILTDVEATSTSTGAFTVDGGVGIIKNLHVGGAGFYTGAVTVSNATSSTSTSTGAVIVTGGVGIGENLNVNNNANVTGNLNVTTDAVILGNLTVSGVTTTINTTTLTVEDNMAVFNSGQTGTADGGIAVQRFQADNDTASGDVVADTADVSGTAQAGASTTITLDVGDANAAILDFYKGYWILITNDSPAGALNQVRQITSNTTGRVATVSSSWTTNPDATTTYSLHGGSFAAEYYDESADVWSLAYIADQDLTTFTPVRYMGLKASTGEFTSTLTAAGITTLTSNTTSTSTGTGSLVVTGGVGISENLNVGNGINGGDTLGDLLVGNGSTMVPLAIGSNGQVLTVSGGTASWGSGITVVNWTAVNFVAVVAPIATIDSDSSRYHQISDKVTIAIDIDITTDGSGPSASLTLTIPAGLSIPCAGPSGMKFHNYCTIEGPSSTVSTGYVEVDSNVGSGATITVTTFGSFANTSSYTIRSSLTYEI